LLSEPFTGLRLTVNWLLANNIFNVALKSRAAVIMVTHDLYDVIEYLDGVVVVDGINPASIVGALDASVEVLEPIAGLLCE
jgi:ABC-type nitrate/sulfonate/bicarbonate transport system ATPase subunit